MRTEAMVVGLLALGLMVIKAPLQAQELVDPGEHAMSSLSIVGFDPETGEVGIAMASRFFAVGPIAVHVKAGVGAIATMGGSPYQDAKEMLEWMEEGASPQEIVDRLTARYGDSWGGGQINLVDVQGRSLSVSGTETMWRGHRYGRNYAAAGNILAGPEVVDGFADTFEATEGTGMPLAERLMEALMAADRAGGDARGRMGAQLVVKKPGAGVAGIDDYVNLRVDNSRSAIHDLQDLYFRWRSIRNQEPGFRIMEQSRGEDVRWMQEALAELGYVARTNREVFDENGEPLGVLNDETAQILARYKRDRNMGTAPSAGLETISRMRTELEGHPLSRCERYRCP